MCAGLLHSGIGPTAMNKFVTTLNIPPFHHKSLKHREREIGTVVETLAKDSCAKKAKEERLLTQPDAADGDVVDIAIGYDGAWQKRGKAHNSLTGLGHAIGVKSKGVLGYGTRNKKCITCDTAKRRVEPPPHHCRLIWDKSSKAMEPDIAVQLAKEASDSQVRFATVIGDDDCSTIKKLREEVDSSIVKWSDITHAKRTVGHLYFKDDLYAIKKSHKKLTANVIKYFEKQFAYAIQQHKDDAPGVNAALLAVVPMIMETTRHVANGARGAVIQLNIDTPICQMGNHWLTSPPSRLLLTHLMCSLAMLISLHQWEVANRTGH